MLNDTHGSGSNHPTHAAGWTDDRIELLKVLWREGKSASESARILGGGVTRNGVISKVHRLKLETRAKPVTVAAVKPTGGNGSAGKHRGLVGAARRARNGNAGQPKAAAIQHRLTMAEAKPPKAMPVPKGLPEMADRLRLSDIDAHRCKFCDGDPLTPDHSFCGQPVKPGTSWCSDHHARVYLSR